MSSDHTSVPSPTGLQNIAVQVGERLSRLKGFQAPGAPAALAVLDDTLPVWFLGLKEIRALEPLASAARPTNYWHHQIERSGDPIAFARSTSVGTTQGAWQVHDVTISPLAASISEAIQWVEDNVDKNPDARLLSVPAYYLDAIWVVRPKIGVVVARRPDSYLDIKYHFLYPPDDFVHLLAKHSAALGVPSL